jgi:LIVCS family branched-chain amino acid:cation transporter
MAIALIILGLFHEWLPFNQRPVYVMTIGLVGLYSLIDVINSTFLHGALLELLSNVPMQNKGFGWMIPGLIGFTTGCVYEKLRVNKDIIIKKAV